MSEILVSPASTVRLPARYYARIAEMLSGRGFDVTKLLARTGLTLTALQEESATLTLAQVEDLVDQAVLLLGREDLGLMVGSSLKLSSHSIVGFGILSSPDLGYALRLAARFFRLIMPSFSMHVEQTADHLVIRFRPVLPMSPRCLRVHMDAIATAAHFEITDLLSGQMPEYEIFFSQTEPDYLREYDCLREARLIFGCGSTPQITLRLPVHVMGQRLALADPSALQMAEARCRKLVERVVASSGVASWVEMVLRESDLHLPSLDDVALMLNMSARTLDRHLKKEGKGFRAMVSAMRTAKARRMLCDPKYSITEIAMSLGYQDAANFSRAFKRELGQSPSEFRNNKLVASNE